MKTVRESFEQAVDAKIERIDTLYAEIALLNTVFEMMGDVAALVAEDIHVSLSTWSDSVSLTFSGEIPPGTRSRLLDLSGKDEVLARKTWDPKQLRQDFGRIGDLPVTASVYLAAPQNCHKAIVRHTEEFEWCGDLPEGYEIVEVLDEIS